MGRYRAEVERGAAFLDENRPGWRDQIDGEQLWLEDCAKCVLGQLTGREAREWTAVTSLFGLNVADSYEDCWYGFNLEEPTRSDWDALTEEWREYIHETRDGVSS